jgi:hypothetical protein
VKPIETSLGLADSTRSGIPGSFLYSAIRHSV